MNIYITLFTREHPPIMTCLLQNHCMMWANLTDRLVIWANTKVSMTWANLSDGMIWANFTDGMIWANLSDGMIWANLSDGMIWANLSRHMAFGLLSIDAKQVWFPNFVGHLMRNRDKFGVIVLQSGVSPCLPLGWKWAKKLENERLTKTTWTSNDLFTNMAFVKNEVSTNLIQLLMEHACIVMWPSYATAHNR